MLERAHPDHVSFRPRWFGLLRNRNREKFFRRYTFCNAYVKNKVVLDIPCGMGWGTSLLKGCKELYGIDIDRAAIEEASRRYKWINFRVGSMVDIDFPDDIFDTVTCLEGIEHISFSDGQKFLGETRRILKGGGFLIITTPLRKDEEQGSGNIYHLYEYNEKELLGEISRFGFSVVYKGYHDMGDNCTVIELVLSNGKK